MMKNQSTMIVMTKTKIKNRKRALIRIVNKVQSTINIKPIAKLR